MIIKILKYIQTTLKIVLIIARLYKAKKLLKRLEKEKKNERQGKNRKD